MVHAAKCKQELQDIQAQCKAAADKAAQAYAELGTADTPVRQLEGLANAMAQDDRLKDIAQQLRALAPALQALLPADAPPPADDVQMGVAPPGGAAPPASDGIDKKLFEL